MKNFKFFMILAIFGLVLAACSDDDEGTMVDDDVTGGMEDDDMTGGMEDDDMTGGTDTVDIPDTYVFERGGESTVSFSGQTTRLLMAREILGKLRDNTSTQAEIDAAFDHQEGANNFSEADLNASDKQVRNKTAGSYFFSQVAPSAASVTIKADFDGYITEQVEDVFPFWNQVATEGNAGQLPDGSSTRYVNGSGLELDQAFIKGLTGAFVSDQIVNNYTDPDQLAQFEDDNDNDVIVDGQTYTDMEHDWDEAYGYFFGVAADAANPVEALLDGGDPSDFSSGSDEFLYKYVDNVEANFDGTAAAIFDAYKAGRTAIINKDYAERDAQADILREKVAMVVAVRAIHYLKAGIAGINGAPGTKFHDLSEAYGVSYSLQYLRSPVTGSNFYFNRTEVEDYLDTIYNMPTNGFWNVTVDELNSVAEAIAAKFSFTVAEVD